MTIQDGCCTGKFLLASETFSALRLFRLGIVDCQVLLFFIPLHLALDSIVFLALHLQIVVSQAPQHLHLTRCKPVVLVALSASLSAQSFPWPGGNIT